MEVLRALQLLVGRSLRQHLLSSLVAVAATALAAGLVMAVFSMQRQSYRAFVGQASHYDAVLGARGSQLQLVLSCLFHLETSPGNIPWALYERVRADPAVRIAVPLAFGDNYGGFRLVGTTLEFFQNDRAFVPHGRFFDPRNAEAVLGNTAAAQTGLNPGDLFQPSHGLSEGSGQVHEQPYTVVGVLAPTNSPADRVIWIPIEGVFRMEGHVLRGGGQIYRPQPGEAIPSEHREISGVLIKFDHPMAGFRWLNEVNREGKDATLAFPVAKVVADLFKKMGWMNRVLELVAFLVVLVAGGAIFVALYNTMSERRGDFTILRAMGAGRKLLFSTIVAEAGLIAIVGAVGGFLVYGLMLGGAKLLLKAQTGVVLEVFSFHPALLLTPVSIALMGVLAGVLPALRAYHTDVAHNLREFQ